MIEYIFTVKNNKITSTTPVEVFSGNVNTYKITFNFINSEEWADLTKFAIFTKISNSHDTSEVTALDENNSCYIPGNLIEDFVGILKIGVYGLSLDENSNVISTRQSPPPFAISVEEGSYREGAIEPTPDQATICEQAMDVARTAKATAQSVRNDADAGVFDGADGYSPIATVTQTQSGATISITDINGTTTSSVNNGVSVSNAQINDNGRLIMSLDNGNQIDAGNVLPALQNKTITPSEIPQTAVADDGYYALGSVAVEPIEVEELETITENGTYTAEEGKYFKQVTVDTTNTDILFSTGGRQYSTKITLPNTVSSIVTNAFENCTNLESIEIPNSVSSIGQYAFQYCTNLESIEIPNSVSSIGNAAFAHCTNLESIEIPNSVSSIGNAAFAHCANLKSIEIPSSVQTVNADMFYNCPNLKKAKLQHGVMTLHITVFGGCTVMTDLELPNTLTLIYNNTFSSCNSLKNISLENGFLATVNFSASTQFTATDIVNMFNALGAVPSGQTRTFTLGATNLNKLTTEQKAIATDKGWTLA